MAADSGRREPEPVGQRRGGLRAALEHEPGDGVSGAIVRPPSRRRSEFHNTSMTYFRCASRTAPAISGPGRFPRCALPHPGTHPRTCAAGGLPARRHRASSTSPPTGPVIFAGQPRLLRRRVLHPAGRPPAGRLLRQGRVLHHARAQGPGDGRVLHQLGHVPVERADTRAAASVIDIGVDVLRGGRALGIFPEGTRSPDGRLHKFRTGVARRGAAQRRAGRPGRAGRHARRAAAGQPPLASRAGRRPLRRTAALRRPRRRGTQLAGAARGDRHVRAAVQELSGQEYVDRYASSARE